ncbi:efflux transporter outer membrane subunit [Trinickia fusca]|uniref:Efflux transporter outer membrane subunit n=1 Tax=Trinickia fusca TaxID=2419777 RepID=A0A494XKN2_9BURK|nr:efflux transporter outer membrane subunit [Trinickia fusca]RKP51275.1 efflux transporter outer membrane subunit [Trinickia fusca]
MLAALAGCAAGPDYRRPDVETPSAWRIEASDAYWHAAAPTHAPLALDWWRGFGDAQLDSLEAAALADNQTLRAASAHYDAARASLAEVASARSPQLGLQADVAREKISGERPRINYAVPTFSTVQNDVVLRASVGYELDLFGRIRREVEAANASTEAAADDLANARLVITADVAATYVALRIVDAQSDVLAQIIALQQQSLDYVRTRHDLGAVSGLDVLQQQTQLDATRTQAQLLFATRAQYEHALAALVGLPASSFSIAQRVVPLIDTPPPAVSLALPSELLERRPDIASAERAMAAANARIGVARAAYFPSLVLNPGIGWEATRFASMLSAPALLWSVGASAESVLFDGGKRRARVDFAQAGYAEAQARYRQTVLDAMQQVQDGVTGLSVLDVAARQAHAAVDDARRLVDMAHERYTGGMTAFIDVISAQQQLQTSREQEVAIHGRQLATLVFLAKALGGGWQAQASTHGAPALASATPATSTPSPSATPR